MLTLTSILYLKDNNNLLPVKALIFSPVAGQQIEVRDPIISYDTVVLYYKNSNF